MNNRPCILAIDQGTGSSRSLVFDRWGNILASHQIEIATIRPQDGWAEQDPDEIWHTTLQSARAALREAEGQGNKVIGIGIANQRETTIVWDRNTSKPCYNAILWHDRRTAEDCRKLVAGGWETVIQEKTGLVLDPYFSATKLSWILDNRDNVRKNSEEGLSLFGTVDSFLLWKLTGGTSHATDTTNASRTSLFNIQDPGWDAQLLDIFRIPAPCLPSVFDSSHVFGQTDPTLFGRKIPILGIIGDQQASALGHGCTNPGSAKSTYGTGGFLMINNGEEKLQSSNRLLSTVAYQIEGKISYATEGSIFVAGDTIKWLRDGLKIISKASEVERLAELAGDDQGLFLVPAFNGIGAPHWDPNARGTLYGITARTAGPQLARAALDAACYQTYDIIEAARRDGNQLEALRVDGGMSGNNWFCQRLADILDVNVERAKFTETTAWGAAFTAGLGTSLFSGLNQVKNISITDTTFVPSMKNKQRSKLLEGWANAVKRTLMK
ncbi:MAG: glycerol kinase GlpK [Pseudomonadota bacterium]|nr:glycerol kinase GlpK [Pseudomonadota bacterium]